MCVCVSVCVCACKSPSKRYLTAVNCRLFFKVKTNCNNFCFKYHVPHIVCVCVCVCMCECV